MYEVKFSPIELQFEVDGEALKKLGMEKVFAKTPEDYANFFRVALRVLVAKKVPFTSNDVLEKIGFPEGVSKNAIGALMNKFAKEGLIEPHGFTKGTRPSQHGHMMRTWVGKNAQK